jgi:pimeloyl-ACP methyl ester carboxylesterase
MKYPGFACWLLLPCVWGASDPAAPGPFVAAQQTVHIANPNHVLLATDVYFPGSATGGVTQAARPCPVLVLGHGFMQSKAHHANHGRHLATRGFIVLIPDFGTKADHARNGQDLSCCLDWISRQSADPRSLFQGTVRLDRFGAAGHSAGGLSALLAAAQDPRIRVLSLLDPVDQAGLGIKALARCAIPTAMTWSEPSSCNAGASAATLFAATRDVKRGVKIVGANHTDAQDPAGTLCTWVCGAAQTNRQTLYRRYLTGWFEYFLHDDHSYAPWVFDLPESPVHADLTAGRITYSATVAPFDK